MKNYRFDLNIFEHKFQIAQEQIGQMLSQLTEKFVSSKLITKGLQELSISLEELQILSEQVYELKSQLLVANQAIERERQHYLELFDLTSDGYLMTDIKGVIQEVSDTVTVLLNLPQDYLIGKPMAPLILQADNQNFYTLLTRLQKGEQITHVQLRLQSQGKPLLYGVYKILVVRNDQNQIIGFNWLLQDFTHLCFSSKFGQQIENNLQIANIAKDAILIQGLDNLLLSWNEGAERLYGWKQEEVLGKNTNELLYKETLPQWSEIQQALNKQSFWKGELYQVTKAGEEITVESHFTLVRDHQGNPQSILIVNNGITERKMLQAQFCRTQRLESIDTLASGIAHEINNILTPILAIAQLLPYKITDISQKNQQLLKIIETNSRRAANLLKQTLVFSQGIDGKHKLLSPKYLLAEIQQIIQKTFPKTIEFQADISPDIWFIRGDSTQLHQVLMSLCLNARDAIINQGKLTISVKNILIDRTYISINPDAQAGAYVLITVADTGSGIPPEVLLKIFEPFFTTKQIGKGTGLGLSIAVGIIKSHGGFIEASSELGKGSEFQLFLPAVTTGEITSQSDL